MNTPRHDCARARLLISDLTQILRDTAHTLQAHHNPAAADWLLAVLNELEQVRQQVLEGCADAPMLPPWEAPTLSRLPAFMDGVDMHATPAQLEPLLKAVVEELADWLEACADLPERASLAAQLRTLPWPELPETDNVQGDLLAPVNEEGS